MNASELTTIKVGGPIYRFEKPETLAAIKALLTDTSLPIRFLGGGSNLVFADAGFNGLLIQPNLQKREYKDGATYLGAGLPWGQAVAWSLENNLSGLHYFARIPCRVGGAVYNNIHGFEHLLSEFISRVHCLDLATLEERWLLAADCQFAYDQSLFQKKQQFILGVELDLPLVSPAETAENRQCYLENIKQKAEAQPAEPSCGSVFKNPVGQSAGKLIDECGLKGKQIGGMVVSTQHANFIVNMGDVSQADFLSLARLVQTAVREKFQIELEMEVECWDEQGELICL